MVVGVLFGDLAVPFFFFFLLLLTMLATCGVADRAVGGVYVGVAVGVRCLPLL